jgi:Fe(II)/alpha-ketoglutarate-dependent arginine beta-hydroxylase
MSSTLELQPTTSNTVATDWSTTFQLTADEVGEITALTSTLADAYGGVENPEFQRDMTVYAQELPRRVRRYLNDLRLFEPAEAVGLIRGYPVSDSTLEPTPPIWGAAKNTQNEDILLALYGSLLGDVFGWATQQDGHLIHDVLPVLGHQNKQINSASDERIWWHTEDSFHPYRCDYVGLMCMRNPTATATTVAPLDGLQLDPLQRALLFEPHFVTRPDESHDSSSRATPDAEIDRLTREAYARLQRMAENPPKHPILFGDPATPYAALDPYFMNHPEDDDAAHAFEAFCGALDARLYEVILQPGDVVFVDNYKAVHGRNSFKANFDGTDRWLKRVLVTRDLRKSRASRALASSRVVY